MVKAKATIEELISAHQELRSINKVAARFGMCAQSVHERLQIVGYTDWKERRWTMDDDQMLRDRYDQFARKGDLDQLALRMGRTVAAVMIRGRRLGLADPNRPSDHLKGKPNLALRKRYAENGHPRKGLTGLWKHTPEARARMSLQQQARWDNMPQAEKDDWSDKQIAGRMAAEGNRDWQPADSKRTWKAAWREIGGQRKYFRSQWEANYARYLQWLVEQKVILAWEHEPKTFWFEGIRRGVCSYKPDFRVTERNGDRVWHEVKGWMDDRSRVTLKRMAKFFPHEKLILIDSKAYKAIMRKVASLIPDWE